MPVLDISDGEGNFAPLARETVLSLMVYPSDRENRAHYLSWLFAGGFGFEEEEGSVGVPRRLLRHLLTAPSFSETMDGSRRESMNGSSAGHVLEVIIACAEHHPEIRPSISKALDLVGFLYQRSGRPSSRAHLTSQWSKFRPVAHLWAAFRNLSQVGMIEDLFRSEFFAPAEASSKRYLSAFLGIAEAYRKQAEGIIPHGQRTAVLRADEAWRPPDDIEIMPLDRIVPGPLTAEALQFLEERRARRRT